MWKCVLELDDTQSVTAGSAKELCGAISGAADLRIHTDFRHNEHIDTSSDNNEMVNEVSEFHETCLLDNRWSAGFMTTRQPVDLPCGFGVPSMSFFMYNQDGRQAIARPHLTAQTKKPQPPNQPDSPMPKYHTHDMSDQDTNAPSINFTYDFDVIKYFVRDNWRQVLSHDKNGNPLSGSIEALTEAFLDGCEIKVAVTGLFDDLAKSPSDTISHEVFIQTGWCYYYSEQKLLIAATHPLVRVRPGIPLTYPAAGWDFGWLLIRTDGFATKRICDPYTLTFNDKKDNFATRWFVR